MEIKKTKWYIFFKKILCSKTTTALICFEISNNAKKRHGIFMFIKECYYAFFTKWEILS